MRLMLRRCTDYSSSPPWLQTWPTIVQVSCFWRQPRVGYMAMWTSSSPTSARQRGPGCFSLLSGSVRSRARVPSALHILLLVQLLVIPTPCRARVCSTCSALSSMSLPTSQRHTWATAGETLNLYSAKVS